MTVQKLSKRKFLNSLKFNRENYYPFYNEKKVLYTYAIMRCVRFFDSFPGVNDKELYKKL